VVAAFGLWAAPAALADEQVAASGQVHATFAFDEPKEYQYSDLWLTVRRAGQVAFDAPVDIKTCEEPYCSPAGVNQDEDALRVRDLDGDGEPEVLLDVFTGGAHCCSASWLLRWTGASYERSTRQWGNVGYRLSDVDDDGVPEFRSADDRFAYAFASYADSAFPVRVLSYRQGRFLDVTKRHKTLVRSDAKRWKREYRKRRSGLYFLGVLAAWTADQYVLGNKREAHRFLDAERRAGRLQSAFKAWKSGAAFIRQLKKRLRNWGY